MTNLPIIYRYFNDNLPRAKLPTIYRLSDSNLPTPLNLPWNEGHTKASGTGKARVGRRLRWKRELPSC